MLPRLGGEGSVLDSGFQKVDVLAKAMESLRLRGGPKSAAHTNNNIDKSGAKSSDVSSSSCLEDRRLSSTSAGSSSSACSLSDDREHAEDEEYAVSSASTTPPSGLEEEELKAKIPPILRLPHEILDLIFDKLPRPVPLSLIYVCRRFYHQALPLIYAYPVLNVYNYSQFVATISGSTSSSSTSSTSQIMKGNRGYINKSYQSDQSSRGKDLGSFVRVLNLTNIIQSGKNSYTSRVLRRCASNLQEFYAPQTSFGYSPLLSLQGCHRLTVLDLSLVSETVDLRLLFSAISNAQHLEKLAFPRSSIFCHEYDHIWPPKLWQLCLSGGISDEFITATTFPKTVTHLILTHCPFVNTNSVLLLLTRLGEQLNDLKIVYPMPVLRPNALDPIFQICPALTSLSISVDYISRHMFDDFEMLYDNETNNYVGHGLTQLFLDSSGMLGQAHKLDPIDVSLAILDEKLPKLSKVHASLKLGWNPATEDVMELAEILDDREGGLWIS